MFIFLLVLTQIKSTVFSDVYLLVLFVFETDFQCIYTKLVNPSNLKNLFVS